MRGSGWLALVLVIFWGLNWPVAAIGLAGIAPITFRILTLAVGGVALMLYCVFRAHPLRVPKTQWARLVVAALLNVAAWNVLSVYAIVSLNSARSAILAFTMPLFVVIIESLLGQQLRRMQLISLAASSVGLAGLIASAALDESFSFVGALAMLGAALCWAAGTVFVKRKPVAVPSEAFSAWSLLIGAAMVCFFIPLQHQAVLPESVDWPELAAFVYAALIGMAVCQVCWFVLVGRVGPVASALTLLAIPPVGVLSSVLMLNSMVSWLDLCCLAFLLLGSLIPLAEGRVLNMRKALQG